MKKYFDEIDVMKGVAMFLTVIGHSLPDAVKDFWIVGHASFSAFLYHWIYSFHMPAFFFCAGFLFIPKLISVEEVKPIIVKRTKRLMIPYLFYSIGYLLMKTIFASYADNPLEENAFLMMFLGVSPSYGCWFLWVLFMISLLFVILRKMPVRWLMIITFGLYLLQAYIAQSWPGHTADVLRHSLWFAIGGVVALNYKKVKDVLKMPIWGVVTFVVLTLLSFISAGGKWVFLLNIGKTLCGIEMLYVLSCYLSENCKGTLSYKGTKLIGDYCMDIYLLSMFVLVPMRILYVNVGLMNYINYYIYVLITVPIGIFVPYLLSKYIIRKNKVLSMFFIGG